jgi:hypothetical protein
MTKSEIQLLIQRYCIGCSGYDLAQAQACDELCPLRGVAWASVDDIAKSEMIACVMTNCQSCVEETNRCDTGCVLTPIWDAEILPILK